jgi:hypothetical protein
MELPTSTIEKILIVKWKFLEKMLI